MSTEKQAKAAPAKASKSTDAKSATESSTGAATSAVPSGDDLELQESESADPLPVEMQEKQTSLWEDFLAGVSLRGRMVHALLGTAFLHAVLPVVLPWIKAGGHLKLAPAQGQSATEAATTAMQQGWNIGDLFSLFLVVGIGSAIGSMVVAALVMSFIRGFPRDTPFKEFPHVLGGAICGAPLALFNIPGYLAMAYVPMDSFWLPRYLLLFSYTGMVSGAWTGWQAYRENHPERGWIPELSIGLILNVLLCLGFIWLLFLPWQQWLPGLKGWLMSAGG